MQKLFNILSGKAQGINGLIIILLGFAFLSWSHAPETTLSRVEDLMFLVGTFYFGASKSGATKDETISNLAQNQQAPIIANSENTKIS